MIENKFCMTYVKKWKTKTLKMLLIVGLMSVGNHLKTANALLLFEYLLFQVVEMEVFVL